MKQSMKRCSTSIFRSLTCTRIAGLKSDRHRFHPFLTIVVRNFGIADTLMDKSTELMGNSKEKQFKDMMSSMTSSPHWTYRSWSKSMEGQLSSWTMYIPGVSSSPEVEELKKFQEIVKCMSDSELDSTEANLSGSAKQRIAKASARSIDEVTRMDFFYKQSLTVATWLQLKKSLKEKLPKTELEMVGMQDRDQRMKNIAMKIMKGGGKKKGRGQRMPF